ncbi:MAG: translation initiation factor IF-3 [Bacteroidales bacterium]|nr:translation initiation factor IF-3 [Bacteroidales bacterium]
MATPFKPRPGGFVKNNNKPNSPAQNGNGQAAQGRKPAKDEGPRINEEIRAKEVRIVGDNIPQQGVVSLREAMDLAREMELDLVEISPNAVPPVCRIIDYQKYLYQQKKKAKEMKANASKVVIKEIRFGPQTDEHDFQFKLKHAQNFLSEGAKVKAYVFFRGRSILFSDQGEKLLLRFAVELEDYGKAEQMPKLEGKRMIMMIAPNKKK